MDHSIAAVQDVTPESAEWERKRVRRRRAKKAPKRKAKTGSAAPLPRNDSFMFSSMPLRSR